MSYKHLDLTLPTGWHQVTRVQAIILGHYFWRWPLTSDNMAKLLIQLAGLDLAKSIRKAQTFKQHATAETIQLILEQVDHFNWVVADLCFEEPKMRYLKLRSTKLHGPTKGLRSMTYQQFMDYADPLCNEYILNRNPMALANLMATLYLPAGKPFRDDDAAKERADLILKTVPQAEQHAALNDFLAMRRWLFTMTEFKALATFKEEPEQIAPKLTFTDVVFELSKEDVTAMATVKRTPLWDVLEGLTSMERKAQMIIARGNGGGK